MIGSIIVIMVFIGAGIVIYQNELKKNYDKTGSFPMAVKNTVYGELVRTEPSE